MQGVEGLIELENPNRVKQKMKKVSQLTDPTIPTTTAAAAASPAEATAASAKKTPAGIRYSLTGIPITYPKETAGIGKLRMGDRGEVRSCDPLQRSRLSRVGGVWRRQTIWPLSVISSPLDNSISLNFI